MNNLHLIILFLDQLFRHFDELVLIFFGRVVIFCELVNLIYFLIGYIFLGLWSNCFIKSLNDQDIILVLLRKINYFLLKSWNLRNYFGIQLLKIRIFGKSCEVPPYFFTIFHIEAMRHLLLGQFHVFIYFNHVFAMALKSLIHLFIFFFYVDK